MRQVTARLLLPVLIGMTFVTSAFPQQQTIHAGGPVYEIGETDLVEVITKKLKDKEKTGELKKIKEQYIAKYKHGIEHPDAVQGITHAKQNRTYYFDPSIVLNKNIADANGKLLAVAGTRVNPFDHINLSKHLLFIDGSDPTHRKFAMDTMQKYEGRIKIILTSGSYMDFMRTQKVRVYYDAQGSLTRRFGIHAVPALVSQDVAQKRLRIDEIAF